MGNIRLLTKPEKTKINYEISRGLLIFKELTEIVCIKKNPLAKTKKILVEDYQDRM